MRAAASALLALGGTRAELLGVELREEVLRAQRLLVAGAVAAMLLGAAAVFAAVFVAVAFWDTHRLLSLALIAVALAGAGAAMLMSARATLSSDNLPFASSAREFRADVDAVRESLGDDR